MLAPFHIALLVWAFAGPVLAMGIMRGREAVLVAAAVKATKVKDGAVCDSRVAQVARAHDKEVDDEVDEAVAAADAIPPTPQTPVEIVSLCQKSASCRSRVVKP